MQNHPAQDDEPKPQMPTRRRALIVAGVVALIVLVVVLHLTGAIGPNTHQ